MLRRYLYENFARECLATPSRLEALLHQLRRIAQSVEDRALIQFLALAAVGPLDRHSIFFRESCWPNFDEGPQYLPPAVTTLKITR